MPAPQANRFIPGHELLSPQEFAFLDTLVPTGMPLNLNPRLGEAEREIRLRLDLAQYLQRRRHHLGADAIAAEHGDVEGVVCGHGGSLEVFGPELASSLRAKRSNP
mgnify:CR=1 FL=1